MWQTRRQLWVQPWVVHAQLCELRNTSGSFVLYLRYGVNWVLQQYKVTNMLDVLTPLSGCRQESVEKMERRISGGSYLYWICTTEFVLWVFVCSINFSESLSRLPRRGLPRPTGLFSGYHAEGYHRTDAFKPTGYHVYRVTTPELPRSIQTSGYRRVITPTCG